VANYRVTCITRDTATDADWRIDAVGFADDVYPIDAVIEWLKASSENRLWVVDNAGNSVWVRERQHPKSGRWYLTTEPDGRPLNNLANLPECP
jgi:hypothetical protein